MRPFEVVARNLPEHARNAIHTDAGAQAAGFASALVAGVTTYAYLCHPALATWGLDWVARGAGEVRFHSPVFAGELVECRGSDDGSAIEAKVGGATRVRVVTGPPASMPDLSWLQSSGEPLPTHYVPLEGEFDAAYGEKAGDNLTMCREGKVVHPAVWPALANFVFHRDLVVGSWIHTRTRFTHVALANADGVAEIDGYVIKRYQRSGERAIAHLTITVDGVVAAMLEHEAIVNLAG